MQILTKKQVKYCRVVTKKSAVTDYCLGISFQDKLFVSGKFFAGDRRQEAIDYCYRKYLAGQGKKVYILVANVAGLTVWQEDEFARIVGIKSPESLVPDSELDSFVIQMHDLVKIITSDRQNDSKIDKSINSIEKSLQRIVDLEQKVRNRCWLRSVELTKPFYKNHFSAQFN